MRTMLSTWLRPGKVAIDAAIVADQEGDSLENCLVRGLSAAEDHPELIAIGRGALPNSDGEIELDAAIMNGSDLSAGAVCGVRGILPVIKLAQIVKDTTPYVMLAGEQARRFALANGFVPENLMTDEVNRRYQMYLESPERSKAYVHSTEDEPPHDTVTMLGREDGHFVAASSTSGLPFKLPGRIGDSPIVGAGVYADDEVGCAGATGMGEELWKACASFRAVEFMRQGMSAQQACDAVIDQMIRRQPASHQRECVVLALDKNGGYGASISWGDFDLWISEHGTSRSQHYSGKLGAKA
ncbi:MAG: isoaspartyl peptidase/L-asparaginase [Armatimonadetes bacterium]|nr:isoaspartyl peptidase/L-asparaginase [Armatimonadota bacterium]